jgi:heme-degrading monooxygenase HmoA
MSDHPVAPVVTNEGAPVAAQENAPGVTDEVVPVAAHQPPYYAVVFTSLRTAGDNGYGERADRMEELVEEIPGYLGMDSARTPGRLGITVGYFKDVAAVEEWRSTMEHRAAQKHGREHWYERYTLHVAKVERSHGFERSHANERGPASERSPGSQRDRG